MLENLDRAREELAAIGFNHIAWHAARDRSGLSQRKVGELIGTAGANIHTIENGTSLPSILVAMRYCVLFDLSMDDLIARPVSSAEKETATDGQDHDGRKGRNIQKSNAKDKVAV